MAKALLKCGNGARAAQASKYDAHNTVLSKTYGAFADLRRELSDSKADVSEREELLRNFAVCADSQRAWLLLEDYFEKLSLTRKDFPSTDWWPRLLTAQGKARLEEVAFLFLRTKRSLPTELTPHGNLDRFAQVEQAAQEQQLVRHLEEWLFPPKPIRLDTPRASLRVVCQVQPDADQPARNRLAIQFHLLRPRTGEKVKTLAEILESDHPRGPRTGAVCARGLGVHSVAGGYLRHPPRRRGDDSAIGPGIDALACALGPYAAT